jgi:hypothetical protein
MTSSFRVTIAVIDGMSARLVGDDLESLARFLGTSTGAPQFDLEFDGCQFSDCRLATVQSLDSIAFSFESTASVDPIKSDPQSS